MASIGYEGEHGERKRLDYRDAKGKQQSLRLGKCSKRNSELALSAVEHLLEAARHGAEEVPHPDAIRWLERIDDCLHARVVALGLAKPRGGTAVTLAMLIERYTTAAAVKPATMAAYKQTTDSLLAILGLDTNVAELSEADADNWRKAITEPKKVGGEVRRLAPATVAKRVHVAKAIFKKALRWGLVASNPFAELRAGSQINAARSFYVSRQSFEAVLQACPDAEWRAIAALVRYAGLRCPSELQTLRWGDVNWEHGRLMVRSPKTAGYEGKAVRVVPMGKELRPILQDLFDRAEVGVEAVVPRLHDPKMNLRTTFYKIIAKAGEKPWPRLFHNMRASCACDWVEKFPAHVVAAWLGHSPLIAAQHYLQTRDAHFDLAAGVGGGVEQAAANPATQARRSGHTGQQPKTQNPQNSCELVGVGVSCDPVKNEAMGAEGFEPPKT